ncbi:MAG TPA: hypothetical protein PL070_08665, partial [Flavobacteriales bacterium]|nr:hypothetical protein [Flavobacteriales bacterium]
MRTAHWDGWIEWAHVTKHKAEQLAVPHRTHRVLRILLRGQAVISHNGGAQQKAANLLERVDVRALLWCEVWIAY